MTFCQNLLKKSYEYQENSENAKNVIKKYTGIDIGEISEKIFSIENLLGLFL